MNIPQGYKRTELGIIPEDWEYSPSQKYLKEISMGPFGSDIKVENFVGFGIPVLNGANLQSYRLIDRFENYVTSQKAAALKKAVANKGDIIITHRGTLGQVTYIPKSAKFDRYVISQSQFRVRFNECIDSEFIVRYLLSPIGQECLLEFKGHTGVPALAQPTTNFRNLPLLIPPIAEQRAIAEVLSDVDGLIAALDKKIAKKRLLKQGAMQQLLTGKKRLPGFTDEWVEKKVKDIFRVTRGYVLATNKVEERPDGYYKYPVFSSQTQNNGVMGYYNYYLFENAITWTTDGANAGEVNYRQGRFYCTNVCGVLMSDDGYANECIASIINMVAKSHVSYIGNPKLMNNVMSDIEICVPPSIEEQRAIATILSDMDKEITDLEAQRDKYRLLKSGMMQKLLTGQIRLRTK